MIDDGLMIFNIIKLLLNMFRHKIVRLFLLSTLIELILSDKKKIKELIVTIYDLSKLSSNSVYFFHRFAWSNYTTNSSGFNYTLEVTYNSNGDDTFHLYLIEPHLIPHFDMMSTPAICCSPKGGVICDEENQKGPYLDSISFYYKNFNLVKSGSKLRYTDEYKVEEGVYYTLLLYCHPDTINSEVKYTEYDRNIILKGEISYFNSNGYLSAEDFYTVDLYLFVSLYYFLLSMWWIYKLIGNYSSFGFYSKLFSLTLPLIILEQMMKVQVYTEMNKSGKLSIEFEWIRFTCFLIKNVAYRVIFFGISVGHLIK